VQVEAVAREAGRTWHRHLEPHVIAECSQSPVGSAPAPTPNLDDRLHEAHAGLSGRVADGVVVRAAEDQIGVLEQLERILRRKSLAERMHPRLWECPPHLSGVHQNFGVPLVASDVVIEPRRIVPLHDIRVDDAQVIQVAFELRDDRGPDAASADDSSLAGADVGGSALGAAGS